MSFKKFYTSIFPAIILALFIAMACASSSSKEYVEAARAGAAAGYSASEGKYYIGNASSFEEAKRLAVANGCSDFNWDSKNGNVYAR